jgi:alkanesulfonate monooxygenase SsuD/methylene tetrahydromethanopterin reductase-like flavin-dependent oxidoreductase (luciferase family)
LKIDMFTEIQDPRPWTEDHEHRRILEALEQARLADEMGYGCFWLVEHRSSIRNIRSLTARDLLVRDGSVQLG